MVDNLRTNANGEASFAHADVDPWHCKGTNFGKVMTSAEALQAASLDYEVTKVALFTKDGTAVPGAYATQASDTKAFLGVVGAKYTPLQNRDAFTAMDTLTKDGSLRYVTAGALGSGERIWLLAKTPDNIVEIVKGDPIEDYLLFSNSHDGSSAVEMRSTSITVVCQNTLSMALRKSDAAMKLRHTASVTERAKIAMGILAAHAEHKKSWIEAMRYLAKHPITDEMVNEFEVAMFGDINETPEGRGRTVLQTKLDQFEHLLVKGKGTEIPGRVGNAYGMVQAYTEWTDWMSQVKGTDDRTSSIVFANGSKQKAKAVETALALVGR